MSLKEFLEDNQSEILIACEKKTTSLAALRPSSVELQKGLPVFFVQLIFVLGKNKSKVGTQDETEIFSAARKHGKELLRLGYTLSHVVHSYGAMCQAITEVASQKKALVTAFEFHNLNRCLDIAIAGAVTEFDEKQSIEIKKREVVHLGVVAHEMRNALNRAIISFEMLSKGVVGLGGSTSKVLGYSLHELSILIDQSLTSVRLRAGSDLFEERFSLSELMCHLAITADVESKKLEHSLDLNIEENIWVFSDRHLILSAIGNLVQNAIKYSKPHTHIRVSAKKEGALACIQIEDECGGFPLNLREEIFKPFVRNNDLKSGLGLGLLIAKEAIQKCSGTLEVHNVNNGCIFTVYLKLEVSQVKSVTPIV